MSDITAILTRTNPLGTTLLLVGDELVSNGSLVSSAEISKDVFERLLTFVENNQEVRAVINYASDSHIKLYDYANTVITDENGNKGVVLEKTGITLYNGTEPSADNGIEPFAVAGKKEEYLNPRGVIDIVGKYNLTDSAYDIYTKINPISYICCHLGCGLEVRTSDWNIYVLRAVGIPAEEISKGRKFKVGRLFSRSSKGDTYDYETDGFLTKENAPNDKIDTYFYWATYLTYPSSFSMPKDTACKFYLRPYIDIYEEDGTTFVRRIYGGQLFMDIAADGTYTTSVYCESIPDSPVGDTIVRIALGKAARRYMYWVETLNDGLPIQNYIESNYPELEPVTLSVAPSEFRSSGGIYTPLMGWFLTLKGQGYYSGFYIPEDIETKLQP